MTDLHQHYMRQAIQLGQRGVGKTADNPSVGCVVVSANGQVVGVGTTADGGRPHAEPQALKMAGQQAKGAIVYVTLEPCSHHGKTPPCCDALIAAEVAHVVIACVDPDPRVAGTGIKQLQAAGIKVTTAVLEKEAARYLADYLWVRQKKRPLVTLKLATTLDARIATVSGDSQWITGSAARQSGHLLRARHDAIAVGRGTMVADQPSLTCRLPGLEGYSPKRVVFDRQGQSFPIMKKWDLSQAGALLFCDLETADQLKTDQLDPPKIQIIGVPHKDQQTKHQKLDLDYCLTQLIENGVKSLLIEGGSELATSFLQAGKIDRLVWYKAPKLIGGDGLSAIGSLSVTDLQDHIAVTLTAEQSFPDGNHVCFYDIMSAID